MTRLAVVPDAPRVIGLVRVSKEREEMISPEVQRASISDCAASSGYEVTGWLEGLDESGSRKKSAWWPRLEQAVAAVEAGEYDVILVWKFSRTARNRLKWAVAVDRVEMAGGRIESATERFDTTTSAGRFARGMLAELNAFEAERIGETWKEAHARRIASGRPASGTARYGYTYDREAQLHKPHPEQGPILAELYRRYVAGDSVTALITWMNARGHLTNRGNRWHDHSMRVTLDSGFASGRFKVKEVLHQGIHEALISEDLWQAYLDARLTRRQAPARRESSSYLLSGLVRCMRCGSPMVANNQLPRWKVDRRGGREHRYYDDQAHLSWACIRCRPLGKGPTGYISAGKVEAVVLEHLRTLAAAVDAAAQEHVVIDARESLLTNEAARLTKEATRLDAALVRLAVSNAEAPLPPDIYEASRLDLTQRAAQAKAALETTGAQARRVTMQPEHDAVGLLLDWDELPVTGRREVLRKLVDCVLVRSGRPPVLRLVEWREVRG